MPRWRPACPAAEYARRATTVMCCLSKGLCAPVGSLLAGPADVMAAARVERQRLGGGMRQAGVIAAAGLVALRTMVDRLADDHRRAARLAEAVAERWPESGCDPATVRTNIVTWRHPRPGRRPGPPRGRGRPGRHHRPRRDPAGHPSRRRRRRRRTGVQGARRRTLNTRRRNAALPALRKTGPGPAGAVAWKAPPGGAATRIAPFPFGPVGTGGLAPPPQCDDAGRDPLIRLWRPGGAHGALGGQDPAGFSLGQVGQPGRLVDGVADHGVLVALLRADVAGDDPTRGHPDAGVEAGMVARGRQQRRAHGAGGPQGPGGVVGLVARARRRRRGRRPPRTC